MKDGKQGVPIDRYLMRAKDIALLVGFVSSSIWAGYTALRFVDRMNDRLERLEARVAEIQGDRGRHR